MKLCSEMLLYRASSRAWEAWGDSAGILWSRVCTPFKFLAKRTLFFILNKGEFNCFHLRSSNLYCQFPVNEPAFHRRLERGAKAWLSVWSLKGCSGYVPWSGCVLSELRYRTPTVKSVLWIAWPDVDGACAVWQVGGLSYGLKCQLACLLYSQKDTIKF